MGRKRDSEPTPRLVNVAVMAAIRYSLTYAVPDSVEVRPGQRLRVPLGTRQATGVVLESVPRLAPGIKVREIARVLDPEPVLSPELLELGRWIHEYYLAPIGEVFSAMLPLRSDTHRVRLLALTPSGRSKLDELDRNLLEEVRAGEEALLLRYLAEHPGARLESVRRKFSGSAGLVARALEEGWASLSRIEREQSRRTTWTVRLAGAQASSLTHGPLPDRPARLSPAARRVLEALERTGPMDDHRQVLTSARAKLSHLKQLSRAGLVELTDLKSGRGGVGAAKALLAADSCAGESHDDSDEPSSWVAPPNASPLKLSEAQGRVTEELTARLDRREFSVVLLHGVTASGKTEIYLQLIGRCLERQRTALMLVPEIALTPAVQAQFLSRFGDQVAVLHSGLSERHEEWWRARRGEAKVVLGTRSAVFAPLANLGVVIVDEEHESSYKQEETPRYHGRYVAVVRALLAQALAVLGSATPSLESAWNARQGKYHRCLLEERIAGRQLASVEIIDMRQEFRETHTQVPISRRLQEEIEHQLRTHAQTMVLLNRRGYSWFVLCRSCGETQRCRNCSISLTYHRREHRLICHYCGYSAAVPSRCPACGSEHLHYVGEGTEKLEQKLAELFPGARVRRLDRDVARRVSEFRRLLSDFREGKIDILVGTQLIAKGHDFPGVTLVGVVSADAGLCLPDFRAAERTFQLLTQAAGRAGRGEGPGRVLVQTFYPEHYAIRLAAEQNYEGFFSKEIRFRRMMRYPPSTALANVIAHGADLEQAARVAKQIGNYFNTVDGAGESIQILGPSPAPLAKIEGRYRIQFLLKSRSRARLNAVLRGLLDECERRGIAPRSFVIDIDPVSIM
jgi:primosomal protein N' (replication factor Y)